MTEAELRILAQDRITEAEILLANGRYTASMYIAGYAVECALKARICTALAWTDFRTFGDYARPMKTHDLVFLLGFTGMEETLYGSEHFTDWSVVSKWEPDIRYEPSSSVSRGQANGMLDAARRLIHVI